MRTGGAIGTNKKNSRGASPVPQQPGPNRSASPMLNTIVSTASNPSSRASPSLHAFAHPGLQQQSKQLHSAPNSSASANSLAGLGGAQQQQMMQPMPHIFPPLPFALSSPSPGLQSASGPIYDATSEEAYLEPDDMPTGFSNVHYASQSADPIIPSVLTVTEPPSPPHDDNRRSNSPKRMRRAASNPTNASTPPERRSKNSNAPGPSPSVNKLLDAIGM